MKLTQGGELYSFNERAPNVCEGSCSSLLRSRPLTLIVKSGSRPESLWLTENNPAHFFLAAAPPGFKYARPDAGTRNKRATLSLSAVKLFEFATSLYTTAGPTDESAVQFQLHKVSHRLDSLTRTFDLIKVTKVQHLLLSLCCPNVLITGNTIRAE